LLLPNLVPVLDNMIAEPAQAKSGVHEIYDPLNILDKRRPRWKGAFVPTEHDPLRSKLSKVDINVRLMCPDCREPTPNLIEDFAAGDLICGSCGIILGDRIIDTRGEWRTFSSSETTEEDPSRVGGPSNPLLDGNNLETIISGSNARSALARSLSKLHNEGVIKAHDRVLVQAFRDISIMCERAGLPQTIADRAKQLYKKVEDLRLRKYHQTSAKYTRDSEPSIAASIYIACRQAGVPRTFKEICALTRVPKNILTKYYRMIVGSLQEKMNTITTDKYLSRFCSHLILPKDIEQTSQLVVAKADQLGVCDGKSPISIAAAVIYLVTELSGYQTALRDIAHVTGVSEVTIKNAYRDLYLRRQEIIPPDMKTVISIDDLPTPDSTSIK
jgi:transcription initiation factor TFIIB